MTAGHGAIGVKFASGNYDLFEDLVTQGTLGEILSHTDGKQLGKKWKGEKIVALWGNSETQMDSWEYRRAGQAIIIGAGSPQTEEGCEWEYRCNIDVEEEDTWYILVQA